MSPRASLRCGVSGGSYALGIREELINLLDVQPKVLSVERSPVFRRDLLWRVTTRPSVNTNVLTLLPLLSSLRVLENALTTDLVYDLPQVGQHVQFINLYIVQSAR